MQFQGSLGPLVDGPVERRQTQFDHRGVDGQQFVLESELAFVILSLVLTSAQNSLEDILIELPWPVLIGVSQCRTSRGAVHAQVLQLPLAGGQAAGDLSQRLRVT